MVLFKCFGSCFMLYTLIIYVVKMIDSLDP